MLNLNILDSVDPSTGAHYTGTLSLTAVVTAPAPAPAPSPAPAPAPAPSPAPAPAPAPAPIEAPAVIVALGIYPFSHYGALPGSGDNTAAFLKMSQDAADGKRILGGHGVYRTGQPLDLTIGRSADVGNDKGSLVEGAGISTQIVMLKDNTPCVEWPGQQCLQFGNMRLSWDKPQPSGNTQAMGIRCHRGATTGSYNSRIFGHVMVDNGASAIGAATESNQKQAPVWGLQVDLLQGVGLSRKLLDIVCDGGGGQPANDFRHLYVNGNPRADGTVMDDVMLDLGATDATRIGILEINQLHSLGLSASILRAVGGGNIHIGAMRVESGIIDAPLKRYMMNVQGLSSFQIDTLGLYGLNITRADQAVFWANLMNVGRFRVGMFEVRHDPGNPAAGRPATKWAGNVQFSENAVPGRHQLEYYEGPAGVLLGDGMVAQSSRFM